IRSFNGKTPKIHDSAFIADNAVIIGDVEIGPEANIWYGVVLRGDVNYIRIGARTNVQDGAVLHVTHDGPYTPGGFPLVIGADVTVGHSAILHACTVEDACLIGMHATVLDGAVVRKHAFVAAGAVVAPGKIVGEGELWMGNPARCVRKLDAAQIEALYYSAKHYVKLKDEYLSAAR
ncbi:MAG TPA: gamma carbonic anhydrase family protein, partial [Rudaea sp.]|nr:gamma carbonic anhydrase family protein [Rudaea sp.]